MAWACSSSPRALAGSIWRPRPAPRRSPPRSRRRARRAAPGVRRISRAPGRGARHAGQRRSGVRASTTSPAASALATRARGTTPACLRLPRASLCRERGRSRPAISICRNWLVCTTTPARADRPRRGSCRRDRVAPETLAQRRPRWSSPLSSGSTSCRWTRTRSSARHQARCLGRDDQRLDRRRQLARPRVGGDELAELTLSRAARARRSPPRSTPWRRLRRRRRRAASSPAISPADAAGARAPAIFINAESIGCAVIRRRPRERHQPFTFGPRCPAQSPPTTPTTRRARPRAVAAGAGESTGARSTSSPPPGTRAPPTPRSPRCSSGARPATTGSPRAWSSTARTKMASR